MLQLLELLQQLVGSCLPVILYQTSWFSAPNMLYFVHVLSTHSHCIAAALTCMVQKAAAFMRNLVRCCLLWAAPTIIAGCTSSSGTRLSCAVKNHMHQSTRPGRQTNGIAQRLMMNSMMQAQGKTMLCGATPHACIWSLWHAVWLDSCHVVDVCPSAPCTCCTHHCVICKSGSQHLETAHGMCAAAHGCSALAFAGQAHCKLSSRATL